MKIYSIVAVLTVVTLAFVSCAGAPGPDSSEKVQNESSSVPEAIEKTSESTIVWEPAWETVMFIDGSVDKQIEFVYDENARIIKIIERDENDELLYLRQYVYESGKLLSLEMSDAIGLVSITTYENNSEGKVVKEVTSDVNQQVLSMISFAYDSEGRVIESIAYDGSGTPQLSAQYEYNGDIVSTVRYLLPGGVEEARFERTLEDNLAVEEKTILPDGTVETSKTLEYENDILTGETHFTSGTKMKSVRYDYDSTGNIIRETWINRSGNDYEIVERRWQKFEVAG